MFTELPGLNSQGERICGLGEKQRDKGLGNSVEAYL